MKNLRLLSLLALALALLAGCSTVDSRIKEKSATFYALPPQTQSRLKQSIVDVGDTPDMVYIALGSPDRTRQTVDKDGTTTTWIYKTYYTDYAGTVFAGYRRWVYWDGYLKCWRVYYEPVTEDVYRQHAEDRTRVVFKDGKVTSIEEAND